MPDNAAKIAAIEALLESGVSSSTVDGVSTAIDRDSLRKELARLRGADDDTRGQRPRTASINLSNLF